MPVFTVTVQEVPEPLTPEIAAPLTPVVLNVKSEVDSPLTDAAKVAVHCTELELVVVPVTAVRELMVVDVVTVIFLVAAALVTVPSLTVNDIVRVDVDAELVEKVMERSAVW